ncbi:hypothetical protein T492DRAFT_1096234 [Pavlovales sp. CCMP2436]|nr:hypothetical protein T492DRAFT_1096234 [Pavlovales sp. CCMP2436]
MMVNARSTLCTGMLLAMSGTGAYPVQRHALGAARSFVQGHAIGTSRSLPQRHAIGAARSLPAATGEGPATYPSLAALEPQSTAAFLRAEVQDHLDREWIAQECHVRIGQVCGDTLVAALAEPGLDSGSLLLRLIDVLLARQADSDIFEEAFVGPFDVANLCSDLLMHRLGVGADCGCNIAPSGVGEIAAAAALREAGIGA